MHVSITIFGVYSIEFPKSSHTNPLTGKRINIFIFLSYTKQTASIQCIIILFELYNMFVLKYIHSQSNNNS